MVSRFFLSKDKEEKGKMKRKIQIIFALILVTFWVSSALGAPPQLPVLISPPDGTSTTDTTPTFTASYSDPDGNTGQINFQVTSNVSTNVYTDAGIPPPGPPDIDIYTWFAPGSAGSVTEITGAGDAPEGSNYQRTTGSSWAGWGVFYISSLNDLSSYAGGELKFYVRTPIDLKVEIQQTGVGGTKVATYIDQHGWDGTNTWQEISIPISTFNTVDLTQIFGAFMITANSATTFDVDNVRWVNVSVIANGSSPVIASGSNGSWTPASPLAPGTYSWNAQAQDSGCLTSGFSGSRTITITGGPVNNPPNTPTLILPANGTSTTNTTPTFTAFYSDTDLDNGQLNFQVATDAGFLNIAANGSSSVIASGSNGSWISSVLVVGTYYWRAQAQDINGGISGWSGSRTITITGGPVNNPPNTPTLILPANGTSTTNTTPTFTALYSDTDLDNGQLNFQVATDAGFLNIAANGSSSVIASGSNGSWISSVLVVGTYYWRAQAQDINGGISGWSGSRTITITAGPINNPPDVPILVLPSSGTVTTITPTFEATYSDPDGDNGFIQFQILSNPLEYNVYSDTGLTNTEADIYTWFAPGSAGSVTEITGAGDAPEGSNYQR
ncbi:hypothetical protein N9A72_00065, partial [bacterium]|nr:hypothetical protein [bacterium]